MDKENVLNRRIYDVSKVSEIIEIILISLGVFLVPLVIPQLLNALFGAKSVISSNSQFIVGAIVNTALIIAGINAKGWKKIISVITLPSLSAIASGLIFTTPSSIYTVYMIPFIWIGNFAIVYLYKYLYVSKKMNYIVASVISIITKGIAIFAGFNLLLVLNVIPKGSKIAMALTSAMGINQIITAVIGSILAFTILKTSYRKNVWVYGIRPKKEK